LKLELRIAATSPLLVPPTVACMLNLLCRLRIATVFAVGLEYFFTEERT